MTLGSKLQTVHNKVNAKLGTQDGTIVFRKQTVVADEFGKPYTSNTNSDVTITAGIKVGRLKAYETDGGATFKIGDLKLIVPGGLITEAQLTDAKIIYGGETYSILDRSPVEIFSGVVVNWRVIARLER